MNKQDLTKYNLPDEPGVYTFRNAKRQRVYIGKATSLKSRVASYFGDGLMGSRGPLLVKMLDEAVSIEWEQTDSVLEALILEANLIKKHQPKYNSKEKSNKSFNYLVITDEEYPRLLIKRGRELIQNTKYNHTQAMLPLLRRQQQTSDLGSLTEQAQETSSKPKSCGGPSCDVFSISNVSYSHVFGPFPYGTALKEAMKVVRKIFPYRDKCKLKSKKGCFNYQIGLCPGVCNEQISAKYYAKIIRNIVLLFKGKKNKLIEKLGVQMRKAAKTEEFEEAARLRNQIYSLEHINDVAIGEGSNSIKMKDTQRRIEAYDVAHMSEQNRVGVMVVLEHGEPSKGEYKKFKIKTTEQGDVAALRELLTRRLKHYDWELPSLIVVDGGKAQVNAARKVLWHATPKQGFGVGKISVVGVVKDKKHNPKAIIGDKAIGSMHETEILLANSESHRFAINYHKKMRGKNLLK